jgi:UDP-N-acetylglucosamine 4,6-dehydratase
MEQLQGSVVSRKMKSALIRDILDLWIREKGGRWEKIEGRPGERPHEYLIGEPELPYTSEIEFDGVQHYVITFNHPVAKPPAGPLCSATAERLSKEELIDIISYPPKELSNH